MRAMAFEALEEFKDELKDFFLGHELNLIRQFNAQGQGCIIKLLAEKLMTKIIIKGVNEEKYFETVFEPQLSSLHLT